MSLTSYTMLDDPPAFDPEKLRAYIKEVRAMKPQDDITVRMIEFAEQILADIEREEREAKAG